MTASAAPQNPQQPMLAVEAQYIKDFSFENPRGAKSMLPQKEAPEIEINVDVKANKYNEEIFEVTLSMKVQAKIKPSAETMFLAELVYAGLFSIKGIPQEHLQALLLVECPRLLFPFARNVLANISREAGFPPLLVQPIDFAGLYRQQLAAGKKA
ncbi:MAG: protein-export chaperone SecB [Dongiaceae bacterium]